MNQPREVVEDRLHLYERLQAGVAEMQNVPDFGSSALDIGGGNGKYLPVIWSLGPKDVQLIDPAPYRIGDQTFVGTLQQWVDSTPPPVDSAFIFNMLPRLATDESFITALPKAVKAGGWLVTSMMEPITLLQFRGALHRYVPGQIELRHVGESLKVVRANNLLHFWQIQQEA